MEDLREWKEAEVRYGREAVIASLGHIKRLVEYYEERINDWGVEMVVGHLATQAGASGTIGAEFHKMVALASRVTAISETLYITERAEV